MPADEILSLKMYDPVEELVVEGIVNRVDQFGLRLMIDGEWFMIDDIQGYAYLCIKCNRPIYKTPMPVEENKPAAQQKQTGGWPTRDRQQPK